MKNCTFGMRNGGIFLSFYQFLKKYKCNGNIPGFIFKPSLAKSKYAHNGPYILLYLMKPKISFKRDPQKSLALQPAIYFFKNWTLLGV